MKLKTISIDDAMIIAKRDRATIYRWIQSKKITAYKEKSGYRWIIVTKSLKNFIGVKRRKEVIARGIQKRTGN
jgi:predicted site-specific integrase-resolvase